MSYGKKLYKSNLTAFDAENVYDSTIGKLQNEINANKVSKDGDTITGTLNLEGYLTLKSHDIVIKDNDYAIGDKPTNGSSHYVSFHDKNSSTIGWIQGAIMSTGPNRITISPQMNVNGTDKYNQLSLGIDEDGVGSVYVTNPSTWCTAIGALDRSTGGTVNGNLTLAKNRPIFRMTMANFASQVGKEVPAEGSAEVYGGDYYIYDKDNTLTYYEQIFKTSADLLSKSFILSRKKTPTSASSLNGFVLRLNSSGNPEVGFSGIAAKNAWVSALGFDRLTSSQHFAAGNTSLSIPMINSESGFVITTGANAAVRDLIWFSVSSSGNMTFTKLRSEANLITITTSTRTMTIANGSGTYLYALKFSY